MMRCRRFPFFVDEVLRHGEIPAGKDAFHRGIEFFHHLKRLPSVHFSQSQIKNYHGDFVFKSAMYFDRFSPVCRGQDSKSFAFQETLH
jgi:hypothetical protein